MTAHEFFRLGQSPEISRGERWNRISPVSGMREPELYFVIPTNRLREVGGTVQLNDEHFWLSGDSAPISAFDDSGAAHHQKYFVSRRDQDAQPGLLCRAGGEGRLSQVPASAPSRQAVGRVGEERAKTCARMP